MKLVVLIKAIRALPLMPSRKNPRVRRHQQLLKQRKLAHEAIEEWLDSAEKHPHHKHHGMGIFKSLEPFTGALSQPLSVQLAYIEHNREAVKDQNQRKKKQEQIDRLSQAPRLAIWMHERPLTPGEAEQYGPRFMNTRWSAVERDVKRRKRRREDGNVNAK